MIEKDLSNIYCETALWYNSFLRNEYCFFTK